MILLSHSFFLKNDAKQLAKMKPYSPLSTLVLASMLRSNGHEAALFDATFATGVEDFAVAKVASNSAASCPFERSMDASIKVDSGEYGFIFASCLASFFKKKE